MRRPTQPVWQSLAALFVVAVLLAGAGIVYTNHAQRESERKWCDLLVPLDDAYSSAPPQTELGRRIAAAMHELRRDFGC